MRLILILLGTLIGNLFKSQRRLEVENLFLRRRLNIALRHARQRLPLCGYDRGLMVWMTWLWPSLLGLSRVVPPGGGRFAAVLSYRVAVGPRPRIG